MPAPRNLPPLLSYIPSPNPPYASRPVASASPAMTSPTPRSVHRLSKSRARSGYLTHPISPEMPSSTTQLEARTFYMGVFRQRCHLGLSLHVRGSKRQPAIFSLLSSPGLITYSRLSSQLCLAATHLAIAVLNNELCACCQSQHDLTTRRPRVS